MTDQSGRRRRTSSRAASKRTRGTTGSVRRLGALAGLIARLAVGGAIALALIALIIHHFSVDDIASDFADPGFRSDGATVDITSGAAQIMAVPPVLDGAKAAAIDALAMSPLNIGALDILANVAEVLGDKATTAKYRQLIYERTKRHTPTLRWIFDRAVDAHDFGTMAAVADAMLRQDHRLPNSRYVMATLGALVADPVARPYIAAIVVPNSAWRRAFVELVAQRGDIDAFPEFVQLLQPPQPTPGIRFISSWNLYFDRLIKGGESRMAYVIWTGLLDPDNLPTLGLLFNGGFEMAAKMLPFDWTINQARGMEITTDTNDPGEGQQSLRVTFGGAPMSFRNILQTLILDPGTYTLSGMVKTENLVTVRGLNWGIYCNSSEGNTQLVVSPSFSGTQGWTRFSVDFTVPARFCDYQTIRLELPARIAAERRIQGSIWVDGLSIVAHP